VNINGTGGVQTVIGKPNPKVVPNPDPNNPVLAKADDMTESNSFMRLMIEQLKAQDPMNPMQSNEFTQQLATLNSLQQLVGLNTAMTNMANMNGMANATSLIGKYVEGYDGNNIPVVGMVDRVEVIEGKAKLLVGDMLLEPGQVLTVDDKAPLPDLMPLGGGA
jgi:flagellar basal-body rod modification protein FlgD